jgi:hypothetical protein
MKIRMLIVSLVIVVTAVTAEAKTPRGTRNLGISLTASGIAAVAIGATLGSLMFTPARDSLGPYAGPILALGVGAPHLLLGASFLVAGPILWHRGDVQMKTSAPTPDALSPTSEIITFCF